MDTLAIDIETYSDVSLPDCGVHRYAASEQFEILLFAYSLNDEPTKIIDIASGQTMPEEIMYQPILRTFFKAGRMEMHGSSGIHAVASAVTGRRGRSTEP